MKSIIKSGFLIFLVTLFCCCSENPTIPDEGVEEQGDTNIKGKVQCSSQGIAGVVVTDGYNFAVTGQDGSYSLPSGLAAKFIYISSPSGYSVAVENSVPQFYKNLGNIADRQNVNFDLIQLAVSDQKHTCIAVGDPQVRNEEELQKLKPILDYLKSDISKNNMNPAHLMVAGDIVFNTPAMHSLSKTYFSSVAQPVYYAIGNHDHLQNTNQAASDLYDKTADDTYESHYGPTYYSFNRGEVHYIVLDNIFFRGGPDTDYSVNITQTQLAWLEKDLSYVSKNKVLFVMLHAPTKSRYQSTYGNSQELHNLLAGYKDVHIIAGHTHYNSMLADNTGITEHIVGAACGGFWEGPVCLCGTYLGYKIFEIDGTTVRWKYRAYEYPDKQFSVFKPGARASVLRPSEELLANVWDWDSGWTVNWSEDNGTTFKAMARYSARTYDPTAYQYFGIVDDATFPPGRTWVEASPTDHIFTCVPASETKKVIIKVTNRFNEEFTEIVDL